MAVVTYDEEFLLKLARKLEEWFIKHGRRYPWRDLRDPFVILITEFLLQRTRAGTIAKIFHKIIQYYGDPWKLASADVKELYNFFSKLGLFYRAERLRNISQELIKKYEGKVPCSMEELLLLKGIGVYIASAVLNFGCGIPTPVVDKNVMRIFNRLFGLTSEKQIRDIISKLYNFGDHAMLAYALIDLGSEVCTTIPRCTICPLDDICAKNPLKIKEWRMLRKVIIGGKVYLREQPVK